MLHHMVREEWFCTERERAELPVEWKMPQVQEGGDHRSSPVAHHGSCISSQVSGEAECSNSLREDKDHEIMIHERSGSPVCGD